MTPLSIPVRVRGQPQLLEVLVLVLTHKEGEVLQIGSDVRIHVKRIKGNWVRLCIEAPRDVELVRLTSEQAAEGDWDGSTLK